jgi:hypothetical protein
MIGRLRRAWDARIPCGSAHARGELPEIISQADFSAVTVFGRYRTGGGTLDLIEALR